MEAIVKLPREIKARVDDYKMVLEGPKGSASKLLKSPLVGVEVKGDEVIFKSDKENRRGKAIMNSFKAHVNNLIKGVSDGYEARLRICYGHFPITVKVDGQQFVIENLGGEKFPRKTKIMPECEVKVEGSEVVITGLNKELVGQTAANIELRARTKNKDLRVFQDGIYLVSRGDH